ncbi:hypothetical protein CDAR_205911 [Caerostris darwini]|uniref:Uncharacterized protein n=1 Tax=Caerostris darwini TaxID=1538125 RepID=A0AAV4WN07_9ARAC|nr:hypothetical protein CDAR_205911 [Caerostris darwini]
MLEENAEINVKLLAMFSVQMLLGTPQREPRYSMNHHSVLDGKSAGIAHLSECSCTPSQRLTLLYDHFREESGDKCGTIRCLFTSYVIRNTMLRTATVDERSFSIWMYTYGK